MKFLLMTSLIVVSVGAMAVPDTQVTACPDVCRLTKPVCPKGQAPTGAEGCWGCCQPIPVETVAERSPDASLGFCAAVCRPVKPVCPSGQAATGVEGCWGCCLPIARS